VRITSEAVHVITRPDSHGWECHRCLAPRERWTTARSSSGDAAGAIVRRRARAAEGLCCRLIKNAPGIAIVDSTSWVTRVAYWRFS